MEDESVARRYAAALFAVSAREQRTVAIRTELQSIIEAIEQNPLLKTTLTHPLLTEERKKATVESVFKDSVSADTLAFLNLLIDKRRTHALSAINDEFTRLVREQQNIEFATAVTAIPLTRHETRELEKSLEARTGKDIELKTEVDPSLMGGVLVRIGDTVLDGTVKGNLERLREHLLARR